MSTQAPAVDTAGLRDASAAWRPPASWLVPDPRRSAFTIAIDLALAGAAMLAALAVGHWLATLAALVVVGRQQNALAVLIHEAAHRRLFDSTALNDNVARWALGAPLWLSVDGFRRAHLLHHSHLMREQDPDYRFIRDFPQSRARFALSIAADLTGLTYLFLWRHYWRMYQLEQPGRLALLRGLLPGVTVNLALLIAFVATVGPAGYLVYWLLPLGTVFPLLLHLRGICEHGGLAPADCVADCTWTVVNRLQTWFVAPHHIHYHIEHHSFPGVTHFHLSELHALMRAQGALPARNVRRGYGSILAGLIAGAR